MVADRSCLETTDTRGKAMISNPHPPSRTEHSPQWLCSCTDRAYATLFSYPCKKANGGAPRSSHMPAKPSMFAGPRFEQSLISKRLDHMHPLCTRSCMAHVADRCGSLVALVRHSNSRCGSVAFSTPPKNHSILTDLTTRAGLIEPCFCHFFRTPQYWKKLHRIDLSLANEANRDHRRPAVSLVPGNNSLTHRMSGTRLLSYGSHLAPLLLVSQ